MNPLITGLHHLLIQVPDLENACREYALVLGESPSARGQSGGEPCALFALANVSLQLLQQDGPPGLVEVGFRVADAARMRRRLERLNLGFTETPTATLALPSARVRRCWPKRRLCAWPAPIRGAFSFASCKANASPQTKSRGIDCRDWIIW